MSTCAIKFSYDTEAELNERITRFMDRRGYDVTRRQQPEMTVAELAALVNRHPGSVSRSLHRLSAPPFAAIYGAGQQRRRIIKITPNEKLLNYLKASLPAQKKKK